MALPNLLSIDLQNDFFSEGGRWHLERPSHAFVTGELFPFLSCRNIRISEIISDYRLPRPNENQNYCIPGSWGYKSVVPSEISRHPAWIKSMNSPSWIRTDRDKNELSLGIPTAEPGKFTSWLESAFGTPSKLSTPITLIGLTLDCCVLACAQELYYRGYQVNVLTEAVDTYSGSGSDKAIILDRVISNWASPICWRDFSAQLSASSRKTG